jgi:hypothetical protein
MTGLFIEKKRIVSLNNALKKQAQMKNKVMTPKQKEIFNRVHKRTLNRIVKLKKNEMDVHKEIQNRIKKLRNKRTAKLKNTWNTFHAQKKKMDEKMIRLHRSSSVLQMPTKRRGEYIFEKVETVKKPKRSLQFNKTVQTKGKKRTPN